MATNEERMMILGMVESGKISAEEGTRLLKALGSDESTMEQPTTLTTTSSARYLRIRVTDLVTGQQKVSVNVPLSVVNFGLRFIPDNLGVNVGDGSQRIDKNVVQAAIDAGLTGRIIEVQDTEDGQKVEVFLE